MPSQTAMRASRRVLNCCFGGPVTGSIRGLAGVAAARSGSVLRRGLGVPVRNVANKKLRSAAPELAWGFHHGQSQR